ncbi:hypothetical protein PT273_00015 [Orbaceae bacterium ESL0727]|nr:hypothetical protein [Orbaceae bacterium ESL0727]
MLSGQMAQLSFFKLPLIFVMLYFGCDSVLRLLDTVIEMVVAAETYANLWRYLLIFFYEQIYDLLPECLLLFGITAITLQNNHIAQVTKKNSGLLLINIFLLLGLHYVVSKFVFIVFTQSDILGHYSSTRGTVWFSIEIANLLFYLLSGLLTYFFINTTNKLFTKSEQGFPLTHLNSGKIHCVLFLVWFFFIATSCYSLLFDYWRYDYCVTLLWHDSTMVFPYLMLGWVVVIIVAVKRRFTQPFVTLQLDRIIKSAVMANVLIFMLNALFFVIQLLLVMALLEPLYTLLSIVLNEGLQIALSALIVRAVVSRYFYRAAGYTPYFCR